eukprot:14719970-Alexandrium_andersonii.AAC.1
MDRILSVSSMGFPRTCPELASGSPGALRKLAIAHPKHPERPRNPGAFQLAGGCWNTPELRA